MYGENKEAFGPEIKERMLLILDDHKELLTFWIITGDKPIE
jgi:hypothetical protein